MPPGISLVPENLLKRMRECIEIVMRAYNLKSSLKKGAHAHDCLYNYCALH